MAHKAPGKACREGISIIELMDIFPTVDAATAWFEAQVWPIGRCCGHCRSTNTREVPKAKQMPYRCTDCRGNFSARIGTAIERSKIRVRECATGIYLCLTSL